MASWQLGCDLLVVKLETMPAAIWVIPADDDSDSELQVCQHYLWALRLGVPVHELSQASTSRPGCTGVSRMQVPTGRRKRSASAGLSDWHCRLAPLAARADSAKSEPPPSNRVQVEAGAAFGGVRSRPGVGLHSNFELDCENLNFMLNAPKLSSDLKARPCQCQCQCAVTVESRIQVEPETQQHSG
jgi:hypothetical protein